MSKSSSGMTIGVIALVAVVALAVFVSLPDRRTTGERLGDAVETLPQGVDKAADELGDKPPAERAADKVEKEVNEAKADLKSASASKSKEVE
jgi:hypothetical protein